MTNLKIKLLLPLLFGLMVVVSLGQGAIAVRSVSDMSDQMTSLGGRLDRSLMIADIDSMLGDVRRLNLMILTASNAQEKKEMVEHLATATERLKAAIARFDAAIALPQVRERFDAMKLTIEQYDALGKTFVEQALASKLYQAKETIAQMVPLGEAAGQRLQEIVAINRDVGTKTREAADASASLARQLSLVGVILAALMAMGAAFFSITRIARPIATITAAMGRLARGDTDAAIPFASPP